MVLRYLLTGAGQAPNPVESGNFMDLGKGLKPELQRAAELWNSPEKVDTKCLVELGLV